MARMPSRHPSVAFTKSDSDRPKLRVAICVDANTVPVWVNSVLSDLLQANYIDVVDVRTAAGPSTWSGSASGLFARLVFGAFDRVYGFRNDPLAPQGLLAAFVPRHTAESIDVCLDLTSHGSESVPQSVHGCWKLRIGRYGSDPAWPPFGREMLAGEPMRRVELQQIPADGAQPVVLCRADFPREPYPSARSNVIGPLWGSTHFFLQKLHELHSRGTITADQCIGISTSSSPMKGPGVTEILRWASRQVLARLRRRMRPAQATPVWRIAIRKSDQPLQLSDSDESLGSFRWMTELTDSSAADPFLFEQEGQLWLFYESIDRNTGHGHINCGRLDDEGRLHDSRTVLAEEFHLSYPHVVRDGDQIYMLPESAQAGGLDLYRAVRFPDVWEKVCRLLEFPCVDSTVIKKNGFWWMFTSPMATSGAVATTWIFRAERLEGPWEFQHSGPLSCTALAARAAGQVFELGDRLVRPSQDCGLSYGRAIVFNEIVGLQGDHCEEITFRRIESKPFPGLIGLHTFNRHRDWEVIDGLFLVESGAAEHPLERA